MLKTKADSHESAFSIYSPVPGYCFGTEENGSAQWFALTALDMAVEQGLLYELAAFDFLFA
jgi:hypothetical protein